MRPLYCSEYVVDGTPSLTVDTDGTCYFCEHYCDKQKDPIGNVVEGVDYDKAHLPEEFKCSPTQCFFFGGCNDYFDASIARFETFMRDKLKDKVSTVIEGDTDSLYRMAVEIAKAQKECKSIITLRLHIKKNVFVPKLRDFLSFLEMLKNSNVLLNVEVQDDAGLL